MASCLEVHVIQIGTSIRDFFHFFEALCNRDDLMVMMWFCLYRQLSRILSYVNDSKKRHRWLNLTVVDRRSFSRFLLLLNSNICVVLQGAYSFFLRSFLWTATLLFRCNLNYQLIFRTTVKALDGHWHRDFSKTVCYVLGIVILTTGKLWKFCYSTLISFSNPMKTRLLNSLLFRNYSVHVYPSKRNVPHHVLQQHSFWR